MQVIKVLARKIHKKSTINQVIRLYSSEEVRAKKFVYIQRFQGEPKLTDFKVVEEVLPKLQDGEFLCKAEYISVDPYMRAYMIRYPLGTTMIGEQVATILESRNPAYPVGSTVVGNFGWKTHTIAKVGQTDLTDPYLLPELNGLPVSYGVGALGMPGNTAYFGLLEICQPKEGETVVVTGAAGAVGSQVGQIAKIKGCNVIGFAGTDEKCQWLEKECGFDHAINYKTANPRKALMEVAPNGVDCFFDNVGGKLSYTIMTQMNTHGRISVCGSISTYNHEVKDVPLVPTLQPILVFKELKMEGFLVDRWLSRWSEGINQNLSWIHEGKIKVSETVTKGFQNIPQALIDMLRGRNIGKAVVKV